ncbi:malate synthase A [Terasakiella pusilla]|uniref:malate synthase A n=1 Tax=Terasakiella pusilla TaxID=64973 RepID=UPI00068A3A6E|nr:malate synthase A [Terasakiella pusilla]
MTISAALQKQDCEDFTNRISVLVETRSAHDHILSEAALGFVTLLEEKFGERRKSLVAARAERQARLDRGEEKLGFHPETAEIRAADWKVSPAPQDLLDRRVEITGPVDRKMIINALNSGAKAFMADFEDSSTPTFDNMLDGQVNIYDAVRRTIRFTDEKSGKAYALKEDGLAVLIVRPRGWHMEEAHLQIEGQALSAALVDFGLFVFNNAEELTKRGTGAYFYLPKMESYLEARLWNDIFGEAETVLGLAKGTIRATVLIETLPAAFEMDEILFELRDYIVGLNCGRWDYIFSMIKTLGKQPDFLVPNREQVTMAAPALRAYSQLLIKTCHRRGAHAMGGMAAQIPIKGDEAANQQAFDKVRADKEREASNGHDGTWVAHPGLIDTAFEAFNAYIDQDNQLEKQRPDVEVSAADLTACPEGTLTEEGLRGNIRVGVSYLEAWLRGQGCVPLYNLMEDAATAEICRTQVWQWLRHGAFFADTNRGLTRFLLVQIVAEETKDFKGGMFEEAIKLFLELCLSSELEPFLTTPAYKILLKKADWIEAIYKVKEMSQ